MATPAYSADSRERVTGIASERLPEFPNEKLCLWTQIDERMDRLEYTREFAHGGEARLYRDSYGDAKVFKIFKKGEEVREEAEKNNGGFGAGDDFVPSHTIMVIAQNARLADALYRPKAMVALANKSQLALEELGLTTQYNLYPTLRDSYCDWRWFRDHAQGLTNELALMLLEKGLPLPPEVAARQPFDSFDFKGGITGYTERILRYLTGPYAEKYPQMKELELPKKLFPKTFHFGYIEAGDWQVDYNSRFGGRFVLSMEFIPKTMQGILEEVATNTKGLIKPGQTDAEATAMAERGVKHLQAFLPKNVMGKITTMARVLRGWGAVHCDLKWENVGVDADGNLIWLDASTLVRWGGLQDYGTEKYMSPQARQQIRRGQLRADPANDMYAITIMQKELMAGVMESLMASALAPREKERAQEVVSGTMRRARVG